MTQHPEDGTVGDILLFLLFMTLPVLLT